jgi:hypothetical protein
MKESFFNKLLRVRIGDLFHIILFVLALLPALIYKKMRPHLWLICEYGDEAQDNGFAFFQYLVNAQPHVDAVYAIHRKSPAFPKVAALGKTVEYGSFKHWIYYLAAEVNISSQKGGKPNAAVCYLFEVLLGIIRNKRVFLQHGVICNDLPYLHQKKARLSLFCCGAKPEYEFVRNTFGYPDKVVQYLGLCRFDQLHGSQTDKDIVLVLPTWRTWLERDKSPRGREAFLNSDYYHYWNALLQDEGFSKLLDRWGKRAVFCLHRNMQAYETLFQSKNPRIRVVRWADADIPQLLLTAGVLVTDFSSVSMDFVYMEKPILYFQFDRDDFRKGHQPVGYFDYDRDGFGPVCQTVPSLLTALEEIFSNGCEMADPYKQRVDSFYPLRDNKNCERTYKAVKSLLEGI